MRRPLIVLLALTVLSTATPAVGASAAAILPAKGWAGRMSLPHSSSVTGATRPAARTGPIDLALGGQPTALTPPLAVRGTDAAIYEWRSPGWEALGGILLADPAVAVIPGASPSETPLPLYIATGADNDLWVRSETAGWRPLSSLKVICLGAPAATVTMIGANAVLTVACRGADSALWEVSQPVGFGTVPLMSGWRSLGGQIVTGPAAAPLNGSPMLFGIGGDSHLWQRDPSGGWTQLSPQCYGHPEAGAGGGLTAVACRGLDNAIWLTTSTGTAWSGTRPAGGIVTETLAVRGLNDGVALDAVGADDGFWEDVEVAAGGSGWTPYGGGILATVESPYVTNVPFFPQVYPLDCETAALQMALATSGHNYTQPELFPLENPDQRGALWDASGTLHWGDPYTNFVGSVFGSEPKYTGYGVYSPPILSIAQSHGVPAAQGGQGWAPVSVYNAVAAGRPVVAWVEYHWARPVLGTWIAWDGRPINYSTWEHAVVIRGVSGTDLLINDPAAANPYWINRGTFEASFGDFGNMAVVF